jgi:cytosine/adenosine deaminase-related metal-dependent hydrolase
MKKPEAQEKQMLAERQCTQLLGHGCTTPETVARSLLAAVALSSKLPAEATHRPVEEARVREDAQERQAPALLQVWQS